MRLLEAANQLCIWLRLMLKPKVLQTSCTGQAMPYTPQEKLVGRLNYVTSEIPQKIQTHVQKDTDNCSEISTLQVSSWHFMS